MMTISTTNMKEMTKASTLVCLLLEKGLDWPCIFLLQSWQIGSDKFYFMYDSSASFLPLEMKKTWIQSNHCTCIIHIVARTTSKNNFYCTSHVSLTAFLFIEVYFLEIFFLFHFTLSGHRLLNHSDKEVLFK